MFLAFLFGLGSFGLFILGFYVFFHGGSSYVDNHPGNHDGLLLVVLLAFACWFAAVGLAALAAHFYNHGIISED